MKKESLVVMLPSNKETPTEGDLLLRHLWKNDPELECRSLWQYKETEMWSDTKVYTTLHSSFADHYKCFEPQHLYGLSDEKPKDGEWGIRLFDNTLFKANSQSDHNHYDCKKIIWTTDESLKNSVEQFNGIHSWNLLKPSNEFLKKFCELGGVDKVLVEYEYNKLYPMVENDNIKLKVNPDNTVNLNFIQ
jgi:hypothetical protein